MSLQVVLHHTFFLPLNIFCYSIALWVYFYGFNILAMFMFHHPISMAFVQCSFFYMTNVLALQSFLHHQFFYIIDVFPLQLFLHCLDSSTSQTFLHCNCPSITNFFMSQMSLHCNLSCIIDSFAPWNLFLCATCVVFNFCVLMFFARFSIL